MSIAVPAVLIRPPMRNRSPNLEPSGRRTVRLSSIAAVLLTASSLGLWSGCATSGNERPAETPREEWSRLLYPERDSHGPTLGEMRAIERENHKRDKNR